MKETKRKGASSIAKPKREPKAATKQQQQQLHPGKEEAAVVPAVPMADPANLRAVMNAHGAGLLGALGQQMNVHLNSLAAFEGTSRTLAFQCRVIVMEIGGLLEALEQYQGAHAEAVTQATLLRRLVAEFALHVSNSQALGIANP